MHLPLDVSMSCKIIRRSSALHLVFGTYHFHIITLWIFYNHVPKQFNLKNKLTTFCNFPSMFLEWKQSRNCLNRPSPSRWWRMYQGETCILYSGTRSCYKITTDRNHVRSSFCTLHSLSSFLPYSFIYISDVILDQRITSYNKGCMHLLEPHLQLSFEWL